MKKKKTENDSEKLAKYQSAPVILADNPYGIMEHQLFRMAIADVLPKLKNPFDKEFGPFHMETAEVIKLFQRVGTEKDEIYTQLNKVTSNMITSLVEIGNIYKWKIFCIFESIKFNEKKGLDIQVGESMRHFLLDLAQGKYTSRLLKLSFSMSSKYSVVLLDLMLQYQGMQKDGIIEKDVSMKELRLSMGVSSESYGRRIDNFRRHILDASICEINEKTDYYIEPKYGVLRRRDNKVRGFHFVLHIPEAKEKENNLLIPGTEIP